MICLLVDIYDLVVKFESDYSEDLQGHHNEEGNKVQAIENEEKDAFYNYLMRS